MLLLTMNIFSVNGILRNIFMDTTMIFGYGFKEILFIAYFIIFLSMSTLSSEAVSADCFLRVGCFDQEVFFDLKDKPSIDNFDLLIEDLFSDSTPALEEDIIFGSESLLRLANLYFKKQWFFWSAVFYYKAAELFRKKNLLFEAKIYYLSSANLFSKIIKYYLHSAEYYKAACCSFYAASGYSRGGLSFYAKKFYNQAERLFENVDDKKKTLKVRKLSSSLSSAELSECLSQFKNEVSIEKLKLIAQACALNNDFKEAEVIYLKIVVILSELYKNEKFLPDDFKLGNQIIDFFLLISDEAKYHQDYFMVQKYYSIISFCYLKMNKERKIIDLYSEIIKHCKSFKLLNEELFFKACLKKIGISETEIKSFPSDESFPVSRFDEVADNLLFAQELIVEGNLLSNTDFFSSGLSYYFAGSIFFEVGSDLANEAFSLSVNSFNKLILSSIEKPNFVSEIYLFLFDLFKKIKISDGS